MNEVLTNLTPKRLRKAATLKERIEKLQNELAQFLNGEPRIETRNMLRKRKMSAAGRAAIAAAARRRWAKVKGLAALGRKPKRKISAATRARMAAVAKERWKKAKAQGKTTL